jgi:hypothetical protein
MVVNKVYECKGSFGYNADTDKFEDPRSRRDRPAHVVAPRADRGEHSGLSSPPTATDQNPKSRRKPPGRPGGMGVGMGDIDT